MFLTSNTYFRYINPHGKVEHKARSILDPALYSERYIKQKGSLRSTSPIKGQDWWESFDTLLFLILIPSSFDHLLSQLH